MGATDAWKSSPKVLLVDYHEPVRYNHEAFFVNLEMSKPTYQNINLVDDLGHEWIMIFH